MKDCGVPVIAGAGVFSRNAADDLLACGAAAVQLDMVLWRGWESK
jgi:NAD(P)H-dependent flavin oxidoreductase YrpB (nitropropane dioxygenase family)